MSSSAWRAAPAIAAKASPASAGSAAATPLAGPGLDDHDADRVGDDVVQLGGDPRALVADGERGVGLPLLVELAGALGQRGRDELALAHRPTRQPCGARPAGGRDEAGAATTPCTRLRAAERHEAQHRPAPVAVSGRRRSSARRSAAAAPKGSSSPGAVTRTAADAVPHAAAGCRGATGERRRRARSRPRSRRAARRPARRAARRARRRRPPSRIARRRDAHVRPPRAPGSEHDGLGAAAARSSSAASRGAAGRARARARAPRRRAARGAPATASSSASSPKRTRTSTPGASSSASSRCSTIR